MLHDFFSLEPSSLSFASCSTRDNRWVPPRLGKLKLNIDVAFHQIDGVAGFGAVIRDSRKGSNVVAFSCGKLVSSLTAHQAKLMDLWEGLCRAAFRDLVIDVVECDALNVVSEVNTCSFDSFFVLLLLTLLLLAHQ